MLIKIFSDSYGLELTHRYNKDEYYIKDRILVFCIDLEKKYGKPLFHSEFGLISIDWFLKYYKNKQKILNYDSVYISIL